jgi:hypothetical protein
MFPDTAQQLQLPPRFSVTLLREGASHPRALMANYQTVGYYENGRVVELKPNSRVRVVYADSGKQAPMDDISTYLIDEAIGYYQLASEAYRRGDLKNATRR